MPEENPQIVTDTKRKPKGSPELDLLAYAREQFKDALSELNIHATCVEYKCTRDYALAHHEILLDHYNRNGGMKNFAKFRSKFKSLCEYTEDCRCGKDCELSLMKSRFEKCPLRKMSEHCRSHCKLALNGHGISIVPHGEFAYAI